jgi:hypothetical protein
MKKVIILIILSSINFSCVKNIEIDKNRIFIRGGIKSEFVIKKIINNNPNDSISFPYNYSVKEEVRLKISGKGLDYKYKNGKWEYFIDGKVTNLKDELDFHNKNQYYHWIIEKPASNKKYDVMPMKFEKNCWYSIRDIRFRDSNCYFEFYVNKKGEFEYDGIDYIILSPI